MAVQSNDKIIKWYEDHREIRDELGQASYDEFVECSIDPLMLHFDCVVS